MSKRTKTLDPTFIAGLSIAVVCILGGLILEKGEIHDVAQVTSALIVLGGTCGAVVVSTPKDCLVRALKRSPSVLWSDVRKPSAVLEDVLRFSTAARRDGLNSVSLDVVETTDPFFKKGMALAIDGFSAEEIRNLLEMEVLVCEQQAEEDARVFEAAGGYAPTIGIIGAVLGLMQVMKHLDNVQDVGRGIAIAFVATVYGVGIANLIFLPIGSKVRTQARLTSKIREMVIEGVIAVQEGKNPRLIRQMLEPFTVPQVRKPSVSSIESKTTIAYTEARKAS
jgi:chemotaxis protein MotA